MERRDESERQERNESRGVFGKRMDKGKGEKGKRMRKSILVCLDFSFDMYFSLFPFASGSFPSYR